MRDRAVGRLIAIEGASGVGKTTAVAAVMASWARQPLSVKLPSTGPLGTLAREFLERGLHETLALTAAADRAFVAEVEIAPALACGRDVIADRYVLSALALNRLGGLDYAESFALCKRLPRPDLTVLLHGDAAATEARLRRREQLDRYERGEGPVEMNEHDALAEAADFLVARGWGIARLDTTPLDPAQTVVAIERLVDTELLS